MSEYTFTKKDLKDFMVFLEDYDCDHSGGYIYYDDNAGLLQRNETVKRWTYDELIDKFLTGRNMITCDFKVKPKKWLSEGKVYPNSIYYIENQHKFPAEHPMKKFRVWEDLHGDGYKPGYCELPEYDTLDEVREELLKRGLIEEQALIEEYK